ITTPTRQAAIKRPLLALFTAPVAEAKPGKEAKEAAGGYQSRAVMAGPVPAISISCRQYRQIYRDARHKAGHDAASNRLLNPANYGQAWRRLSAPGTSLWLGERDEGAEAAPASIWTCHRRIASAHRPRPRTRVRENLLPPHRGGAAAVATILRRASASAAANAACCSAARSTGALCSRYGR